jgi:hypothetical protein
MAVLTARWQKTPCPSRIARPHGGARQATARVMVTASHQAGTDRHRRSRASRRGGFVTCLRPRILLTVAGMIIMMIIPSRILASDSVGLAAGDS